MAPPHTPNAPPPQNIWRKCSSCKKPILHRTRHYVCSVSTCNRIRTGYVFCSVTCWDIHLPTMNHRSAWAEERTAPAYESKPQPVPTPHMPKNRTAGTQPTARPTQARVIRRRGNDDGTVIPIRSRDTQPAGLAAPNPTGGDILVVASRLKAHILANSSLKTSQDVLEILSDTLRALCDTAIQTAQANERKTVLDRDLPPGPETPGEEVLVVVSKLKAYIKNTSGMNTSNGIIQPLSDHLRALADTAMAHALQVDRETVMARDFHPQPH